MSKIWKLIKQINATTRYIPSQTFGIISAPFHCVIFQSSNVVNNSNNGNCIHKGNNLII